MKTLIAILALAFTLVTPTLAWQTEGTFEVDTTKSATVSSNHSILATLTPTRILSIHCQKGSVEFDMATGITEYKDCAPDEAAQVLFRAFSGYIESSCRAYQEAKK
jgi:hypothetical protein